MNISLPYQLEDYIKDLLEKGGYSRTEEVIEEALREHQARRMGREVAMTPELERLLDDGLQDLNQARTTDELRRGS